MPKKKTGRTKPKSAAQKLPAEPEKTRFPLGLLSSFLAIQLFALAIGAKFVLDQISIVEDPADVSNSFIFFFYILAAAVVLILVLTFYKGKWLFYLMELGLLFSASQVLFSLFVPDYSLLLGLLVMGLRVFFPPARNVLLMVVAGIVGALLGASFDIFPAALFSILLAAYDYVAVFKTKHMVFLAQELYKRGAAFAVSLGDAKQQIELGTGDIVISSMLAVSSLKIGAVPNVAAAFSVITGAVAGLFFLVLVLRQRKGYLPALPPLVASSLVFLLVYYLVSTFVPV